MGHPEYRHGRPELFSAPRPEGVIAVGTKMGQRRWNHLALLAKGAGEQVNVVVAGGVAGHGQPGRQRLVIGVRVNEQQPHPPGSILEIKVTAHRRDTVARSTVPKRAWLSR